MEELISNYEGRISPIVFEVGTTMVKYSIKAFI